MSYLASWSGGKDSCLACYLAIKQGGEISYLVNFISQKMQRVNFHGTDPKMVLVQSQALGIPLLQKETTLERYEQEFKEAVESLKPMGIKGMTFGDIGPQVRSRMRKDWMERVCRDLGIEAMELLWGKDPEEIVSGFLDAGFEAVIISAKDKLIDEGWIGQPLNKDFVAYLRSKALDVCGENGEYHTFVVNGPIFKRRVRLTGGKTVLRRDLLVLDGARCEVVR